MALLFLPGTPVKVLRDLPLRAPYPLTTTNTNEHSEVTAYTAASSSCPSPFRTELGKRLESSPCVLEPGECKVIVMEKGRLGFSQRGFTLERFCFS